MSLVSDLDVVATLLYNKLQDNATALGINGVYYGDQARVPTTPAVCVDPDNKIQRYKGASPALLDAELNFLLVLYYAVIQSAQDNLLGALQMASKVEHFLYQDRQLLDDQGVPQVISLYCPTVEAGVATKANSVMRAVRIHVQVKTNNRMP